MKWAILTSGPYMEMMHFMWAPRYDEATDTYQFCAPLGQHGGAIPMIHLDDLGLYARWLFDHHQDKAVGMDLEIATAHVSMEDAARAFTKTTGRKAVYVDVPIKDWLNNMATEDASSAYQIDAKSEPGVLTWHQNFTGWWNVWRHSGGNHPLVARDYELLDQVHATPIHTLAPYVRLTRRCAPAVRTHRSCRRELGRSRSG
jgi:hypothetical protein